MIFERPTEHKRISINAENIIGFRFGQFGKKLKKKIDNKILIDMRTQHKKNISRSISAALFFLFQFACKFFQTNAH